ncbi:MAG: MgtC/SapB family protein [Halanaerobacter sp.]
MGYQQIVIRLVLAFLMGGLVGLERERNSRPAGFRTNILVSVGAALIMIVSIKLFLSFPDMTKDIDPSRMPSQVVSGIGFLGAGTIIREKFTVKGLTTAASMWALSGIGLAIGAGFYISGIFATMIVILTLTVLNRLEDDFYRKNFSWKIRLEVFDQPGFLSKIGDMFNENKIIIKNLDINPCYDEAKVEIMLEIRAIKNIKKNKLLTDLGQLEEVSELEIEALD